MQLVVESLPLFCSVFVCPRNYSAHENTVFCLRAHGMRPYIIVSQVVM